MLTPIADDISQVQLPLPFALSSINCYLLRSDGGGHGAEHVKGAGSGDGNGRWRYQNNADSQNVPNNRVNRT